MLYFTYRNLILFFRDRAAVLLSFLSDAIIVLLYFLFLRDNLLDHFKHLPHKDLLIDVWMLAGLMGVTSISVSFGVYSIFVEDRQNHIYRDLSIIPRSSFTYLGGYLLSASIISFLSSFFIFIISECYFWFHYGILPGSDCVFLSYLLLLLVSITGASVALFIVSFIKTSHALASCCTIFGALIGFLTGIYLPPGSIPSSVRTIIIYFPISHGAMLFRQVFMTPYLNDIFHDITSEAAQMFMNHMGIQFSSDYPIFTNKISVIVLMTTTLISFFLSFIIDHHIRSS